MAVEAKRGCGFMRKHKAQFGSISSGTLLASDLITAFADELRYLRGAMPKDLARNVRAFEADRLDFDEFELVNSLIDALQEFAPPYAYFGAHPSDGADFGFWLYEDFEHDFDGLKVSDTADIPREYRGEVLHVNDHGNITLYVANSRGLREVWAAV